MDTTAIQADQLRAMAEAYPDAPGYRIVDGPVLTFGAWERAANALARALAAAGVRRGDRVAIHVSQELALRWLVAYTAIHRAGAVAVPLNPRLAPAEVERMLDHCSATAIVTDGERVPIAWDLATHRDDLAHLRVVVDASETTGDRQPLPGDKPAISLTWEAVNRQDTSAFQVPVGEDDLADIIYTSGTTGRPKGVAVHHRNAALLPNVPPSFDGKIWLHASPLFTFAGVTFVYNPMKMGMTGAYQVRFDAEAWIRFVAAEHPAAVFVVPSMVQLLLDRPDFAETDLSSIEICAVGSAPLAPAALERLQERMPRALVSNNYGMTEAGSAYFLTPHGEAVRHPGSVGRPLAPAEVRCVDGEGTDVAAGETGEVWIRVPGRPREYYDDPDATAKTWVDGWLRTGDIGKLDADGYLYIVGREKDVIIRGGNNIHAADVEHTIAGHPAVAEVAVVGVFHEVLGEDVAAAVVFKEGASAPADELRRFCLATLADYKVPRRWLFVEALPRNATDKVVKHEVRALFGAASGGSGASASGEESPR